MTKFIHCLVSAGIVRLASFLSNFSPGSMEEILSRSICDKVVFFTRSIIRTLVL